MNLPIILPAHSVHLPAGNNMTKIVNEGAVVTDDAIRAIVERANALGLFERKEGGFTFGVPGGIEYHSSTTRLEIVDKPAVKVDKDMGIMPPSYGGVALLSQPAAPADDEATVQAICKIIGHPYHKQWEAERLIRSIQRDEVPGLTTLDKCSDLINEHARAMNERDTLKAEVERLSQVWKEHAAMAQEALVQRDAANARAEKDREQSVNDRVAMQNVQLALADERDAARAAHAEAMELLKQWRRPIHLVNANQRADSTDAHLAKYGKDASK